MMRIALEGAQVRAQGRLADLYRLHAAGAARLAYLITGDEALAEDLVHDAFIKISGRFADLRDPEAFGPYLKRTIVNLANSFFRRRKLERAYLQAEGDAARVAPAMEAGDPLERQEMWNALRRLPPRQRAAIALRFYEDLTEQQTADVLGCPVGTVKSMVSRGLEALRKDIQR